MKNLLICSLLCLGSLIVAGQSHDLQKLNLQLARMIADPLMQHKQVNILVQGSLPLIQQITENHGGIYRYSVGNIATIKIPVTALPVLASAEGVSRIESPGNSYTVMNDSMRSTVRVNDVQLGLSPLPQGFDGTGIAVGIIDTGVDFTHPDLKDSSGNTRVKYLWDQRKPLAANTPVAYGYGQEWNNTEIDAGLAASHDDWQGFGHGTHVTGITAGDGSAINKNKGVAPGADIIEVAFDFNNSTDPTYIDAVDYIFNKAQLLGKPCVINASLGDYYGSHDGYDLQSQMISTLLNQQSGRVMVAAAGNAGNIPFHLGYNVTTDTSFTWIRHNTAYPNFYIQLWGDTSDFDGIDFSLGADVNTTSASYRGRLPFRDIFYNLGMFKQDTLFSTSGNKLALVQSFGSIQGPAYSLEFLVIPDSTTYAWRLMTTGSGRFDMWKFYDGTGQPGYVNSALPSAAIVPEIVYYKLPDLTSTIVTGFQCLENVITVGNYGNRNSYVDVNGTIFTDASVIPGAIAANSSKGPTRDGRIKPDIAAPGGLMLSCGQLSLMAIWLTQPTNAPKIAEGGFHIRDGGTSSSSPVVAGVAALYLQQNPTASAMQVKNAIMQCAVQDAFTGNNLPDNTWGAGKVDAFNTLANCNMTTLPEIDAKATILLFPNPVHTGETVSIQLGVSENNFFRELIITDVLGKIISVLKVPASGSIQFNTAKLNSGLYMVTLKNKKAVSAITKLSVLN
ncbi:MAG: S8 family peptidase [Bacteroidota bacterium]|nr:S8 family peptidase [Bacteroidota bacterium]